MAEIQLAPYPNLDIDAVFETALLAVSQNSAWTYKQTYTNWLGWCEDGDSLLAQMEAVRTLDSDR